jgi:hypothetical protein
LDVVLCVVWFVVSDVVKTLVYWLLRSREAEWPAVPAGEKLSLARAQRYPRYHFLSFAGSWAAGNRAEGSALTISGHSVIARRSKIPGRQSRPAGILKLYVAEVFTLNAPPTALMTCYREVVF